MDSNSYTYRFGTAEFDATRFELRVGGLPVDIEPRALEVLHYLLQRVDKLISKEELLSNLWAGRVTVEKVLPNAVNKLRRALGASNAEHICTLPRLGYRLDGPVSRAVYIPQHSSVLGNSLIHEIGQKIPGREHFELQRQLGKHQRNEVWLAEHSKTYEKRVYKFATEGGRLRDLKREVTVSRLLQECLPERACFVEIIDWNFESAPYFLESEYGGENLLEFSASNLAQLRQDQRIALFLQIVDAVALAHSVGVLHKDIKPANILIESNEPRLQVRIADFGSASLLDSGRLESLGITRLGMTQAESADSLSGTPLYLAPELFSGSAATVQSDVFALGILFYQLLSGQMSQPMVSGWEDSIADDLLVEDLYLATHVNPERRMTSAIEFAARLRDRDGRKTRAQQLRSTAQHAQVAEQALARSNAKRPYIIALVLALAIGLLTALGFQQSAMRARNLAQNELARASALSEFLNDDLISRANPLVASKGPEATLRDVLLAARARVASRFAKQPMTEATIRASLGGLFESIDLFAEAEVETRLALKLTVAEFGNTNLKSISLRSRLARILSKLSRFADAKRELEILQASAEGLVGSEAKYQLSAAWSAYNLSRGDFAKALPELETAVQALREFAPENAAQRDALRIQLIFAYTLTENFGKAQAQGHALIKEASARTEDSAIAIALAKVALARSYSKQNQHDQALALLLAAEPVVIERFGAGHSRHVMLTGELLGVAFRKPDWPKALKYAEAVHSMIALKMGANHDQTHVALTNWGLALYESGDLQNAEVKLASAYQKLALSQGAASIQTQDALYGLTCVSLELNQLDAAEKYLSALNVKTLVAARGDENWLHAINALQGVLLLKRGEEGAGIRILQSALKGLGSDESNAVDRFNKFSQRLLLDALAKRQ